MSYLHQIYIGNKLLEFFNSVIFVFSVEGWILCKRGDFKYFMDCLFEIMYDYMISSIASHGFVLKMILVLFHLINLNLILGGWILLQLPQVNFKWSCFSLSSKQMNRPPNTISRELFPRGALIFLNICCRVILHPQNKRFESFL